MKIVTFGEIMLRLAPQGYLRFMQEPCFQATYGGGEANVAVSLASFGADASFVTKLPENDIADGAIGELKRFSVNTSDIVRGGERIGIYYLEKGASMRPSKVIYDRAHSSVSEATPSDFNWDSILDGANLFHFTGITPALGDNVAAITFQAVKAAKAKGIKVSCDLNYRKKLWTKQKAREVMGGLMPYVDILIANEGDADDVFGIKPDGNDVENGKIVRDGYVQVAENLANAFNLEYVAITLRESISANDNNWGAMLYKDGQAEFSRTYPVRIVDRVGGGDSFGAGLIYSILSGKNVKDCVEFAAAASALKHTVEGDFNRVSVKEVEALLAGNATGRVQR